MLNVVCIQQYVSVNYPEKNINRLNRHINIKDNHHQDLAQPVGGQQGKVLTISCRIYIMRSTFLKFFSHHSYNE